jgi:hypothetical protein
MARFAAGLTVGTTTIGAENFSEAKSVADPANASTTAADKATLNTADTLALTTDKTTVDGNIATLVADGATPTQAHVNTLNTNWTTMKTDMIALHNAIVAYEADIAAGTTVGGDVILSFDAAKVGKRSVLRRAVDLYLLPLIEGGLGGLTP